jgi:hypothetical protein
MHDPRVNRSVATQPVGWETAYWRKQAEFAAETLRTSQLTTECDRLRTEIERLTGQLDDAGKTIRALAAGDE